MEHRRRTRWTGRPRPQHASAHGASATLRFTINVSPTSTSTSCSHTRSILSALGSITAEKRNRQTRVFRNAVTSTKQRTATCSNRQKNKFRTPDNLQTSSFNGNAFRERILTFLTGSALQTEFAATHSKQKTGTFLTGARIAIKLFKIRQLRTQKLARRGARNRYDVRGFSAFLPGSAQKAECDVTHSKQTTAPFLPGATTAHYLLAVQLSNRRTDPILPARNLSLIEFVGGSTL
jgi:hypothetical protein